MTGNQKPKNLNSRSKSLLGRIRSLYKDIKDRNPRLKPLFRTYISCIEEYKKLYPHRYTKFDFEEIQLKDQEGNNAFTVGRVPTLEHQTGQLLADLRALCEDSDSIDEIEPPLKYPERVTLRWLIDNVPWKLWLWAVLLLIIVFCAGLILGAYLMRYPWFTSILETLKHFG